MKSFIENRKGQKIAVMAEGEENMGGTAVVMHGLGGFKEQEHVRAAAEAFLEEGFTTVRFDTTNSLGESHGSYENATLTNYYEDLEDVVGWVKKQGWFKKPLYLCGHSLGGISTILYAIKHPEYLEKIIPMSPVISGKLSLERHSKEELEEMERTGWRIVKSSSKPGEVKKLKWNQHIKDRLKYDLLKDSYKIKTPTLIIVGENDTSTPLKHQKLLFEKLKCEKKLHVIKGAPHTFRDEKHLEEIKKQIKEWVK